MNPTARTVRIEFRKLADPKRAPQMQAYMKSAMPYLGIPTPLMRRTCKVLFRESIFESSAEWQALVLDLWRGACHREERYAAIELTGVRQARDFQTPDAIALYEEMIVTGAWWDFVDTLASNRIGPILRDFPRPMKKLMREWSTCDDMWKRRTSILCQLGAKQATDLKLLYDCIEPSIHKREFFLRKAIGWALRQYAWTDAEEVRRYVKERSDDLSPLSKREALKNLSGQR